MGRRSAATWTFVDALRAERVRRCRGVVSACTEPGRCTADHVRGRSRRRRSRPSPSRSAWSRVGLVAAASRRPARGRGVVVALEPRARAASTGATLSAVGVPDHEQLLRGRQATSSGSAIKTLVEHWNGQQLGDPADARTRRQRRLQPQRRSSCPSTKSCFAVGSYAAGSTQRTLVEHWNGSALGRPWRARPRRLDRRRADRRRRARARRAASRSAIFATRSTDRRRWRSTGTASSWGILPSAEPVGVLDVLNGVACPSAAELLRGRRLHGGLDDPARWWSTGTAASWGTLRERQPRAARRSPASTASRARARGAASRSGATSPVRHADAGRALERRGWSHPAEASTRRRSTTPQRASSCPIDPGAASRSATHVAGRTNLVEHWNGERVGEHAVPRRPVRSRTTCTACGCPSTSRLRRGR